ncbi:MAG: hypothetical protein HKN72_10565 [Gemmatimonadetes bacterium]|nr:hypothetical protein [Gemmatimonadota bacterium]NNL30031.1 hypothetical protein [Gemmatimonadota bacterium]
MASPREDVQGRIDAIESSYEFFLAYAAQGLTTDEGAKAGAQLRDFLGKLEGALDGLGDRVQEASAGLEPAEAWSHMVAVVRSDSDAALAAVRLVSARPGVSSQLVDNLNANIHLRALLTDLFLVDDLLTD